MIILIMDDCYYDNTYAHRSLVPLAKKGKVKAVDALPSGLERTVSGQKVGVDVQVLWIRQALVLNTLTT